MYERSNDALWGHTRSYEVVVRLYGRNCKVVEGLYGRSDGVVHVGGNMGGTVRLCGTLYRRNCKGVREIYGRNDGVVGDCMDGVCFVA